MIRALLRVTLLAVVLLGSFVASQPVLASDPITVDGTFTDWAGELNLSDPVGDVQSSRLDIVKFWWADNDGESSTYWRVDRVSLDDDDDCDDFDNGEEEDCGDDDDDSDDNGDDDDVCRDDDDHDDDDDDDDDSDDDNDNGKVRYLVYVDTNNNGVFTENVDREVLASYLPRSSDSEVDVTVRYADTDVAIGQVTNQDWGEDEGEGGKSVEFKAAFSDLGIVANQTVRMYVESVEKDGASCDRAPDTGDIQWSPVNIMGFALLSIMMLGGIIIIWHYKGRHAWITR